MSTEPVGSFTEEAAKLLAVLQGWAGEHATVRDGGEPGTAGASSEDPSSYDPKSSSKEPTPDHGRGANGPDCRWCPLCRVVRAARATSPEARDHLANAATSLVLAVQELLATPPQPDARGEHATGTESDERGVQVEKIDLAED